MYRGGGVQNQAEKKKMPSGQYQYQNLLFQTNITERNCQNVSVR